MKRTRLVDVAREAEVSLTTASLALTGKGRISRRVREQVLSAAARLGYRKRGLAAADAVRGTRYVGILHHVDRAYEWDFIRPFFLQMEAMLIPRGLVPVLVPIGSAADGEGLFSLIAGLGIGAVFSIHYSDAPLFTRLETSGIRVIIINNGNLQDRFSTVCVDDFQGAYEGARYLIGLGHRDILYVEYRRPDNPTVLADRFVGFRKALDEHGIPFGEGRRITVDFMDTAGLRSRLQSCFEGAGPPTAVFAHDDYIAAFVLTALRELGRSVPEDVSIIAPGDVLDYSQPFLPRITTLKINTALMSRLACNLLLDRLRGEAGEGPPADREIQVLKVKQQLVKRGSCRQASDGKAAS